MAKVTVGRLNQAQEKIRKKTENLNTLIDNTNLLKNYASKFPSFISAIARFTETRDALQKNITEAMPRVNFFAGDAARTTMDENDLVQAEIELENFYQFAIAKLNDELTILAKKLSAKADTGENDTSQHNEIHYIFLIKKNICRYSYTQDGLMPQVFEEGIEQLQIYTVERYKDGRDYRGWSFGYTREQKIHAAIDYCDQIICHVNVTSENDASSLLLPTNSALSQGLLKGVMISIISSFYNFFQSCVKTLSKLMSDETVLERSVKVEPVSYMSAYEEPSTSAASSHSEVAIVAATPTNSSYVLNPVTFSAGTNPLSAAEVAQQKMMQKRQEEEKARREQLQKEHAKLANYKEAETAYVKARDSSAGLFDAGLLGQQIKLGFQRLRK